MVEIGGQYFPVGILPVFVREQVAFSGLAVTGRLLLDADVIDRN